jgi:steroid 5-alpha reductase family enzyme
LSLSSPRLRRGDPGRRWLVAGLTAAWGLRLGWYLARRKLTDREEDRRYARIFLLVRVSGKAMLERDIGKRRPGYADYINRTSGFFPMPPKRGARAGSG